MLAFKHTGIKDKLSFHVYKKLLNHCFLPFYLADNCHMVWKLSHNWSKCCVAIIHVRGMPPFLAITLSFWPDCSGAVPTGLPAPLMWFSLPEICANKSCAAEVCLKCIYTFLLIKSSQEEATFNAKWSGLLGSPCNYFSLLTASLPESWFSESLLIKLTML